MIGRPRLHLRETGSTNDRARELAQAGAPHGTLVTASAQTAGRGRQGRTWIAPPGTALLASLVLRGTGPLLPLAAGVAVAQAVGGRVKWPNDILLEGRKVAGILAEGRPQQGWAVLGIGINVALRPERDLPPEVAATATSLGLPRSAVEDVLARVLGELERVLALEDVAVLEALRLRDALRGHEVAWAAGAGVAAGVDEAGRLLIDVESGTVALEAGEVHLLR